VVTVGKLKGSLSGVSSLDGRLRGSGSLRGKVNSGSTDIPVYSGEYEVIPGDNEQVLRTEGKKLIHDIIVEAIPSNYGKITWDGSVLTVS